MGSVTRKPGRLYLHVFQWAKHYLTLYGLKNVVKNAYLLADGARTPLPIAQRPDPSLECHALQISVPAQAPDERVSVIALEIEGEPEVDLAVVQGPSGHVALEACLADLHREAPDSTINLGFSGWIEGWVDPADWLTWDATVVTPGTFDVELITSPPRRAPWEGGTGCTCPSPGNRSVSQWSSTNAG